MVRIVCLIFAAWICSAIAASAPHGEFIPETRPTKDGFVISSKALELHVSLGAVTHVVNRITREVHTTASGGAPWMPRGVICARGDLAGIEAFHQPWAKHQLYNGSLAESISRIDHYPSAASSMSCTPIAGNARNGIRCEWTGLTDGVETFPNDRFIIEASADASTGFITLTAEGSSSACDVIGVNVPILNLHSAHTMTVPSFGGITYQPSDFASGGLVTLNGAPFIEAPVIALGGEKGSLGLWTEDAAFQPYVTLLGGDAASRAVGLEQLNYMPFAGQHSSRRVTVHVGAFEGRWPNAMAPFAQWYRTAFREELRRRDGVKWPLNISVIADSVQSDATTLGRLTRMIDPTTVLLHEWNPRKRAFDTALPDWTPSAEFVPFVKRAHGLGFKVMGYVNSYCVNVDSPVFARDRIAQFALARKFDSVASAARSPRSLATVSTNEILYLDPLSPGWRAYHNNMMVQWRLTTSADANYEDTAGTSGDFGNGEIAGLRGAQGGWAQFRELQQVNPIPIAAEYAPDNIAFAPMWALRYSQMWGTSELRTWWALRHRPVSTALFGPGCRAWVPTVNASTETRKFQVMGCSDALGGVAQLEATTNALDARTGMVAQMVERARLFARLRLIPTADAWPADERVACQYRDASGALYHYRATREVQELVPTSGVNAARVPLYQRVSNLREFTTPLRLPGWPAWRDQSVFALNPACPYPLSAESTAVPVVQITSCPSGYSIERFIEASDHVLCAFRSDPTLSTRGTLRLTAHTEIHSIVLFESGGKTTHDRTPLTMGQSREFKVDQLQSMLLLRKAAVLGRDGQPISSPFTSGAFVNEETGLARGGAFPARLETQWRLGGAPIATPFKFVSGGGESEIAFDSLIIPPSRSSAIEVAFMNRQTKFGNGSEVRVYVNGKLAHSEDLGPRTTAAGQTVWDTQAHVWQVPVGSQAGCPTVVTVAVSGKGDDNADEMWISQPRFVSTARQVFSSRSVGAVAN